MKLYHGTHVSPDVVLSEGLRPGMRKGYEDSRGVWLDAEPTNARCFGPVIFEVDIRDLDRSLLEGEGQTRIYHGEISPELLSLSQFDFQGVTE